MEYGDTSILTFGDKLKLIRRKYGLRQDELSGNDITRNLISEIETNKANITRKTAEIIIKNLKSMASRKKFTITETMEYLLESELEQANKVLDSFINELKTLMVCKDDSFIKKLKDIEKFFIKWDIKDKKIVVYELAGDYFYNKDEMYRSVSYYERALELINKISLSETLLIILRKLSMMYIYIGNYNESIKCCEFALDSFADMSQENVVIFRHNNSLNYKKLKNYKKALYNIKIAENLVDRSNEDKLFKVLNSKAVCLYEMDQKRDALVTFNQILNLISKKDVEKYLITLLNIVDVNMDLGMNDEATRNFDMAIKELENLDINAVNSASIYFQVAKTYKSMNKEDLSEKFYLEAANLSEKRKNYLLSNEVLCDLIELYTNKDKFEQMNSIKERTFFTLTKQEKINHNLIYKLVSYYNGKDADVVKEIINFTSKF